MIATHNIKVNGRFYAAGEVLPEPEKADVKQPEAGDGKGAETEGEAVYDLTAGLLDAGTKEETEPESGEEGEEKPKAAPRTRGNTRRKTR